MGQQDEVNDLLVTVVNDEGKGKLEITLELETLLDEVVEAVCLNHNLI